jgi:hypothetical protein
LPCFTAASTAWRGWSPNPERKTSCPLPCISPSRWPFWPP